MRRAHLGARIETSENCIWSGSSSIITCNGCGCGSFSTARFTGLRSTMSVGFFGFLGLALKRIDVVSTSRDCLGVFLGLGTG